MQNFQQETEKINHYNNLETFNISVFLYKLVTLMFLTIVIYKHIFLYFFGHLPVDYLIVLIITAFPFAYIETRKIKITELKQKAIQFDMVNVYQFICEHLKSLKSPLDIEYAESVYLIVTGKFMQNSIKRDSKEDTHIKLDQIQNKTLHLPSIKISQYLNNL